MYDSSHSERTGICSVCNGCGRCSGKSFSPLESAANEYRGSFSRSSQGYSSNGNKFSYAVAASPRMDYGQMAAAMASVPIYSGPSHSENTISFQYQEHQRQLGLSNYRQSRLVQEQLFPTHREYAFVPDSFLIPGKGSKFVGQAEEVKDYVEEAFENLFQTPFPDDIKVSVLDEQRFRKLAPHGSTIGLSINRRRIGLMSEIFVLNGSLGTVMLTIGHELGHVLTETLPNPHDEEAKAYAFSLEWMRVIKEHNIANLKEAIILERPAENGLHNVAFEFVHDLLKTGKVAAEIYSELITKNLTLIVI